MEETKRCPYCGEKILAVARKCKHCGEWLDDQKTPGQDLTLACGKESQKSKKLARFM